MGLTSRGAQSTSHPHYAAALPSERMCALQPGRQYRGLSCAYTINDSLLMRTTASTRI